MSKPRFDSSRMLPLFKIIAPQPYTGSESNLLESTMTSESQVRIKHKRRMKKPEVSVHKASHVDFKSHSNDGIIIHKSQKSKKHNQEEMTEGTKIAEKPKIKRKHLIKENYKIAIENRNLSEDLTNTQHALVKKETQIGKFKDKISSIQNLNKELIEENSIIKTQYQEILLNLEEFKEQVNKMSCSNCIELQNHLKTNIKNLEMSKNTNKDLYEDIEMLKNVIYRLNVQLERYQQKLRKNINHATSNNTLNISPEPDEVDLNMIDINDNQAGQNIYLDVDNQHRNHLHTPLSWGNVNSHTLGPLLDAYQDTINEKEDIIKKYELELANFTDKLKVVIGENELFHQKSTDESDALKKNIAELESNRKELKITKDQNDLLIKKCALKHDKLQEICKVYDHKIECMKRDYEVLQEQYHKTRVELNSLQGKYQSVVDMNDSLKSDKSSVIPVSVHTASVNECKRLFEELKIQYDVEKSKLINKLKLLENQSNDLEAKVVELGAEKNNLQGKVKNYEKQIKKLQNKLSENQSALTHTQISRDACKRQLGKAIEFGRELVNEQEALLQQLSNRSKENRAVKQIGTNIVSRMDVLKTQLKTVQKDAFQQLASVEQRIQEQDSSLDSMRKDHEIEIDKLLLEINDKDALITKLMEQNRSLPSAPYLLYRDKRKT